MSNTIQSNHRVLVIDDNEAIHRDFRKILGGEDSRGDMASLESKLFGAVSSAQVFGGASYHIDSATQGEAGFDLARKGREDGNPYAVAFVDMRMPPGWDGLRTIREIWSADPELNVVICTAFSDQSWSEIETAGGDGDRLLVLKKPFEPIEVRRLTATLTAKWTLSQRAAMKMSELESLVKERTKELHDSATHDKLTGLLNRAAFTERLAQTLELSRRDPEFRFAVLFLDFDRFKWVNDSLGHEAGDALLKAISERLGNVLREADSVTPHRSKEVSMGRLGGDEFCALLAGTQNENAALVVADRLLKELAVPYEILGHQVRITASIGIAYGTSSYERAEDIIRDADTAMYHAKADGKGRGVLFDKAMQERARRRLTIESELHRAVERGELIPYFQPIVRLDTGALVSAEALVRWQHPQRGLVSPGEFIAIAEESGFINVLGLSVLESSCRQMQEWRSRMPDLDLSVNVNVSTKQLMNADLCSGIESILRSTGLNPKALILEITETALMGNVKQASEMLAKIKALGVRVHLDDFGTGYSSLSMLRGFHLDGLKIDQCFTKDADTQRHFAAIIRAIIDLAHDLGMEVVAEGVETRDQLVLLQAMNCEKAQGYLFSPAVCAADFEKLLGNRESILAKARGIAA